MERNHPPHRPAARRVTSGNAFFTNTGAFPHTGTGYVFMGNANRLTGSLFQQITLPIDATSATLTFWRNVTSQETATFTQFDEKGTPSRASVSTRSDAEHGSIVGGLLQSQA